MLSTLYSDWHEKKKIAVKIDRKFVTYLNDFNIDLDNGHLYYVPKTKCRGNRCPY